MIDIVFKNDTFSSDNLTLRYDNKKYYSTLKTDDVVRVQVDNMINLFVYASVRVERHVFKNITNEMIENEHDVLARNRDNLLSMLQVFYKEVTEESELVFIHYSLNVDRVTRQIRENSF